MGRTPGLAWGLTLAVQLAPYLGLRVAAWLVAAQPHLDFERAPVMAPAPPRPATEPYTPPQARPQARPLEKREPRAQARPRSERWVLRPEHVLAVVAWAATACAIGAAAADVIQRNPPAGATPLAKASAPPYSYFSPVRTPDVRSSTGR